MLAPSLLRLTAIRFSNWTLAVIVLMQHPLWWKDGSVLYYCCWSSPVQSFSGPSPAVPTTTFYSLRFETPPNLESKISVFISPRNKVSQLYPKALGSLFVAFYDTQEYAGRIWTRLHIGPTRSPQMSSRELLGTDHAENTAPLLL
jgi:hypothetical protein